jgi:hypothetical protein
MIYPPLPSMEFVDDGMYNNQWNIYDVRGNIFAQVFNKADAEEIFFAVNYLRGMRSSEHVEIRIPPQND